MILYITTDFRTTTITRTERGPSACAAANEIHYERRRPEETTLYQVVQEQLESFLAQVQAEIGARLPEFIKEEFDAFLECGILPTAF
jgi:hypothetical protein